MFHNPKIKFIFTKNDSRKFRDLCQVVCCEKHQFELDSSYVLEDAYYGSEKCIVCEVKSEET